MQANDHILQRKEFELIIFSDISGVWKLALLEIHFPLWTIPRVTVISLSRTVFLWVVSAGFLVVGLWMCVFSCSVRLRVCCSGVASQVHEFPSWKHPKMPCVLFFSAGRDGQSLYFLEPMPPFKFTYKKELTLVQKFALQTARGNTIWTRTSAWLMHGLSSQISHHRCRRWRAGEPSIVLADPWIPWVTLRMQKWGLPAMWLKDHAASW